MNCAPITVTGGADNNDVLDTLPTMFVINLPREQCENTEMEDFVFPDPGKYVETAFKTALGSKTAGTGCASVTKLGAGSGSAGSAAAPTYAASSATSSPPSYNSGSAEASAAPQSSYQASPTYSATMLATVTTTASVTTATSASEADSDPADYATNQTNGTCSGGAVSCQTPGNVVCIGSSQFGLCDINNCAVPEDVASGTSCSGGVVAKRHSNHVLRHAFRAKSF